MIKHSSYIDMVIIVGLPYHMSTPRVNAKIKYYDKKFGRQGWVFDSKNILSNALNKFWDS